MIITQDTKIIKKAVDLGIETLQLKKWNFLLEAILRVQLRRFHLSDVFLNRFPQKEPEWILLFDANVSSFYMKELNRRFPRARKILWLWNPVSRLTFVLSEVPREYEIWSYSEQDCRNFGLQFNPQFLFIDPPEDCSFQDTETLDVFYVGRDKGRREGLVQLQEKMLSLGLRVDFHIVANRNHTLNRQKKNYKKALSYAEVIQRVKSAKAVLDYYEDVQMGLSLRPLEALFFQKKLITNNVNIERYPYYCPENVYLLRDDELTGIQEFMERPMCDTTRYRKEYTMAQWFSRFDLQ